MQTPVNRKNRKNRYAAPIGGIFVTLAVIGVITVIVASLRLTMRVLDTSAEKERLGEIIQPVLMFDPSPFESPQDIQMSNLLLYSMWATLTSDRAQNYSYSENAELMIPASDLDVAATGLFGSDIQLEHQTFTDYYSTYSYDRSKNTYFVPVTAQLFVYTPDVREITKEGDLYRLDVYYVPPNNAWNMIKTPDIATTLSEKHMYYFVSKNKNSYQIVKMQEPPSAIAMANASSSEAAPSSSESSS